MAGTPAHGLPQPQLSSRWPGPHRAGRPLPALTIKHFLLLGVFTEPCLQLGRRAKPVSQKQGLHLGATPAGAVGRVDVAQNSDTSAPGTSRLPAWLSTVLLLVPATEKGGAGSLRNVCLTRTHENFRRDHGTTDSPTPDSQLPSERHVGTKPYSVLSGSTESSLTHTAPC